MSQVLLLLAHGQLAWPTTLPLKHLLLALRQTLNNMLDLFEFGTGALKLSFAHRSTVAIMVQILFRCFCVAL